MSADVDFAAAGLLDGLEGPARDGRLRLLRELHDDGVALDELRAAVAGERLALLPVDRALGGRPQLTAAEVAGRAGVDPQVLLASRRALGLWVESADDPVFAEEDVDAARRLRAILDAGLPAEAAVELTRAIGRSMAQTAAAMRLVVGTAFLRPGDTEHDLATRLSAGLEALLPTLAPTLERAFALHLRELLSGDSVTAVDLSGGALGLADEVVVGFADLVGFTRLGGELPAQELADLARRLETLAEEVSGPRVRLVKTIGDAVMLVARSPAALLDAVLELLAAAEADDGLPPLRCGIALGEAHERDADFFGHAVNVASRLTATARPGSVLVTEAVRDAAGDGYRWSFAGSRTLRGVSGDVKLFRARAAAP